MDGPKPMEGADFVNEDAVVKQKERAFVVWTSARFRCPEQGLLPTAAEPPHQALVGAVARRVVPLIKSGHETMRNQEFRESIGHLLRPFGIHSPFVFLSGPFVP